LFWFALVALPFSVLGAVFPPLLPVSAAAILLVLLVAAVDAVRAPGRLAGVSLELPPVVRGSQDRPLRLDLTVVNERQQPLTLRLGLPLPPELGPESEDLAVTLPAGSERSLCAWPCQPARRGSYRLRQAHLETASGLGLWAVRGRRPVDCEVRVYPNLLGERRNVAALFLKRGSVGAHAQRQVGRGRDFEKLREYVPGDGYDEIHWKATARRGHPVTKVFQIERTQEVYVVLDASRLSARPVDGAPASGTARLSKQTGAVPETGAPVQGEGGAAGAATCLLDRFIASALVLGQAAERQGDLFGLVTIADGVRTFLRASNGRAHYSACRDALYTLEPADTTPDFEEIASTLRLRLRRRALLLFLTSLDDPVLAEAFVRHARLLCRQHLLIVTMPKPPGADPLFARGDVGGIDDVYRHLGGHLQWHRLRELERVLGRLGVRFHVLEQESLAADLVNQYLGAKRRQLI
jgi:uncharacterized protein (DUF58 family)